MFRNVPRFGFYRRTTRSPKTTARLTQRNIFEQQYFGWPNQPSSGLDVTSKPEEGWFGQPKYCCSNILRCVSLAVVFGLLVVYFLSLAD